MAGVEMMVSRSAPATNCVPSRLLAFLFRSIQKLLTGVVISNGDVGDRGAQDPVVGDDVSMLENHGRDIELSDAIGCRKVFCLCSSG